MQDDLGFKDNLGYTVTLKLTGATWKDLVFKANNMSQGCLELYSICWLEQGPEVDLQNPYKIPDVDPV